MIVVGGRFAGVWRSERKGSRVEATLEPFKPLPGWARKAGGVEVERVRAFLGASG